MEFILNIDTAVDTASICLSASDKSFAFKINPTRAVHGSWIHNAIKEILKENEIQVKNLAAIAVSSGPGSYTGLRIGMSAAKGLCYAFQLPLITVNTLKMMAVSAINGSGNLLCPMIDARRMEVFTSVYDENLNEIIPFSNIILDENSFLPLLEEKKLCFFGNGSYKYQSLLHHKNASFKDVKSMATHMIPLSYKKYTEKNFADLAYSEPFYGKNFHSSNVKRQYNK